jgi:hypothetical protein
MGPVHHVLVANLECAHALLGWMGPAHQVFTYDLKCARDPGAPGERRPDCEASRASDAALLQRSFCQPPPKMVSKRASRVVLLPWYYRARDSFQYTKDRTTFWRHDAWQPCPGVYGWCSPTCSSRKGASSCAATTASGPKMPARPSAASGSALSCSISSASAWPQAQPHPFSQVPPVRPRKQQRLLPLAESSN